MLLSHGLTAEDKSSRAVHHTTEMVGTVKQDMFTAIKVGKFNIS